MHTPVKQVLSDVHEVPAAQATPSFTTVPRAQTQFSQHVPAVPGLPTQVVQAIHDCGEITCGVDRSGVLRRVAKNPPRASCGMYRDHIVLAV